MHNKNRKISEVSRMLDLATFGSNKQKTIKETFNHKINKNKKIIKENDFDFDFDLDDVFDNDGEGGSLPPEQNSKSSENLSFPFKLAVVSYDLSNMQAALLNLKKDDMLTFGDLESKSISPSDDNEAVVAKPGKRLYPLNSTQEFKKLADKGRFVIRFKGHDEELKEGTSNVFKWLGGTKGNKDFNQIGMGDSVYKLSNRGKATLDFLARILSGQPEGEEEELILEYVKSAKSNAYNILSSFYNLAIKDIIAIMTGKPSLKDSQELIYFAEEGIAKALRVIYGEKAPKEVSGDGLKEYKTSYNPNKPVGPFIFQITKNHVINKIAEVTRLKPNIDMAEREFERRRQESSKLGSNLFIVPSRKAPSNNDNAVKVEQEGIIHLYYYKDVIDAIEDLEKQVPHMKPYHLRKEERRSLFDSVRHTASPMSSKMDTLQSSADNPNDSYAAEKIKNILSKSIDWMAKQKDEDSKTKYGITKNQTGDYLSGRESDLPENLKKIAIKFRQNIKRNYVNFMYDFLIQMTGVQDAYTTKTEKGKEKEPGWVKVSDIGKTGDALYLAQWVKDYNEKMINYYNDKLPNRNIEQVKKFLNNKGALIKDVQPIYNGLKDYFKEHPEEFEKVKKIISIAKFDDKESVMKEQKNSTKERIRAKIRKTIMESIALNEESNISTDMINSVGIKFEKFLKDEESVSTEMLNKQVSNILNTGTGKYNLDMGRFGVMKYISSVLASLFELSSSSEKNNIINYLFSSLFPKGDESNAAMFILARISGLNTRKPSDKEILWSAVTEPQDGKTIIEKALETYKPERASDFISWVMNRIAQKAKSLSQKEYSHMQGGERKWRNDASLDAPMGGSGEEGDDRTLMSKMADKPADEDKVSKDFAKKMIGAFLGFINKKLEGKKALKDILTLFGDERVYNDKGKIDNKLIANILDTSVGAVRKNKNALMNVIKKAINSGELGKFMKEKVGVNIENYPKIKNFLETGDLVVGTYGSGSNKPSKVKDNNNYDEESEDDSLEYDDNYMFESFLKGFKKYNKIILK